MAVCEKCWNDAFIRMHSDPSKNQSEHYQDLLEERKDTPCGGIKYYESKLNRIIESAQPARSKLIEDIRERLAEQIDGMDPDNLDDRSWPDEQGIIISGNEAMIFSDLLLKSIEPAPSPSQKEAWESWNEYCQNCPNNLTPNPNSYIAGYNAAMKKYKSHLSHR